MLLQGLELQGFKTFPDKTSLTFGPGDLCRGGPKRKREKQYQRRSPVGFRGTVYPALRCSKMEDVIFGGTAGRKPTGFAQVDADD